MSVTDKAGNTGNQRHYDSGQRKKMTDGTGASTWTFDSMNRLTQTTDGANHSVSYGYILPNTTSTPDLRDPATAITYGPSQTVKRDFDDAGRMTSWRPTRQGARAREQGQLECDRDTIRADHRVRAGCAFCDNGSCGPGTRQAEPG